MTLSLPDREWIEERARAAGFDLAGVASVPDPASPELRDSDALFADWVAAGYAGEMEYLKRQDEAGRLIRGDLRRAFPWARSVVVCATNYNSDAPLSIEPAAPDTGWIARYAWSGREASGGSEVPAGSDYHDVLLPRLRAVEQELQRRFGGPDGGPHEGPADGLQTRCYVDTGPLVERGYAARAGVGWIGKNTCVLHQEQGSWLLLGVIVTSLELEQGAWGVAAADRCGTCTRCIDACPTDALFVPADAGSPRKMDASRCIAYLTIEHKGPIAPELRGKMGRQVFGCDICQDVCPWNRKRTLPETPMLPHREKLINPELAWLASLDGPLFNRWFRGSPLERTRRKRILRNVAIAMGNSGQLKFLPQLEEWSGSDDPVLADAAAWAAARLQEGPKSK
jgi:epoxyqueuosine reductase